MGDKDERREYVTGYTEEELRELNSNELKELHNMLIGRKNDLESKIANAKYYNRKDFVLNSLTTLYASVCGMIAGVESSLIALGIFGVGTAVETIKNAVNKSELETEHVINQISIHRCESQMEMKLSK